MSDVWADHARNGSPLCCLRRSSGSSPMNSCTSLQETAALGKRLCGDDWRTEYFFYCSLLGVLLESVPSIISMQACSPSRRLLNRAEESVRVVALTSETDCPRAASRLTVAWLFIHSFKYWETDATFCDGYFLFCIVLKSYFVLRDCFLACFTGFKF